MDRLGFLIDTFTPLTFAQIADLARLGEELGYERVYTSESLTDTFACDMLIACRTRHIRIGSSVAIIYLRHALIAAQAATAISDASGGRFLLGLGLSHAPRNRALGVTFAKPLQDMRAYVAEVRDILEGRPVYPDLPLQTYAGRPLEIRRPAQRVPLHIAAVGPRMIELGGEIADGLMLYMIPRAHIEQVRAGLARGAATGGRDPGAVETTLAIHVLVSNDVQRAREQARDALTYWVGLPTYNRAMRAAGFGREAAQLRRAFERGDQAALRAGISDELLDQYALLGPPARVRDGLAEIREAGIDVPILKPDPVEPGESYLRAFQRTLRALAPNT